MGQKWVFCPFLSMIRNFGGHFCHEKKEMAYFFQKGENVLIENCSNPGPFGLKLNITKIHFFGCFDTLPRPDLGVHPLRGPKLHQQVDGTNVL